MENTMFRAFLIKYGEIAIKGKNRYMFEDALVSSMKHTLAEVEGTFEVTKEQGRIYVFVTSASNGFTVAPYLPLKISFVSFVAIL